MAMRTNSQETRRNGVVSIYLTFENVAPDGLRWAEIALAPSPALKYRREREPVLSAKYALHLS